MGAAKRKGNLNKRIADAIERERVENLRKKRDSMLKRQEEARRVAQLPVEEQQALKRRSSSASKLVQMAVLLAAMPMHK